MTTPAESRSREQWAARSTGKGTPAIVWWIAATHLVLLLAYSIVVPTYRAPDEPHHVDLAHLFSEEQRYPNWDERDLGSGIVRSLSLASFGSRAEHLTASSALPKNQRPAIDDLEEPPIENTSINQIATHPPLYYVLAGSLERGVEFVTGDPIGGYDFETWFYRLVSILLVAPLPLIIWRVADRLRIPAPVAVAAMLVPLAIPQYLHIGSAVNNDAAQMLLFWLLTPVVIRLADGDLRRRMAFAAGALTGLGLINKGFALIMPLWVLAGLLVALRRLGRSSFRPATQAGLIYALTSFAIGGWWWLRNVVVYGEPLPSRFGELVPPDPDAPVNVLDFIHSWGYATTRRFWGDFGWYDTHIPGVAVAIATVVCLVGLLVSCIGRDRVAGTTAGNRLLLAAPFLLLAALQFAQGLRGYLETGRMAGLQGRYWFGALAAVAVMVALGLANLLRRGLHRLPLATLVAVVAMQAVAVSTLLGFYWGAPHSAVIDRLRAIVAWAPLPGEVVGVGAIVGGIIVASTVAQVTVLALRPPDGPDHRPVAENAPSAPARASLGAI